MNVMAFIQPAACNKYTIGSAFESFKHKLRANPGSTHCTDYSDICRVMEPGHPGQICTGITAPVAEESHNKGALGLIRSCSPDLCQDLFVFEVPHLNCSYRARSTAVSAAVTRDFIYYSFFVLNANFPELADFYTGLASYACIRINMSPHWICFKLACAQQLHNFGSTCTALGNRYLNFFGSGGAACQENPTYRRINRAHFRVRTCKESVWPS